MLPPVSMPQILLPRDDYEEDEEEPMDDAEGYQEGTGMNDIEEDEEIETSLVDKFSGGFKKVRFMTDLIIYNLKFYNSECASRVGSFRMAICQEGRQRVRT